MSFIQRGKCGPASPLPLQRIRSCHGSPAAYDQRGDPQSHERAELGGPTGTTWKMRLVSGTTDVLISSSFDAHRPAALRPPERLWSAIPIARSRPTALSVPTICTPPQLGDSCRPLIAGVGHCDQDAFAYPGTIEWRIVGRIALGALPLLTSWATVPANAITLASSSPLFNDRLVLSGSMNETIVWVV